MLTYLGLFVKLTIDLSHKRDLQLSAQISTKKLLYPFLYFFHFKKSSVIPTKFAFNSKLNFLFFWQIKAALGGYPSIFMAFLAVNTFSGTAVLALSRAVYFSKDPSSHSLRPLPYIFFFPHVLSLSRAGARPDFSGFDPFEH